MTGHWCCSWMIFSGRYGSFNLINSLARSGTLPSLMLVASYREQEIGPTHPIRLLIDNAKGCLNQVKLEPLSQEQISHLLADTLHREPNETRSLAHACLQKTQGNPFFPEAVSWFTV